MAGKCGKDKLWKWRACLSCRCDQGVEQVEESNSISLKQPNWDDFWVGLPFIIVLKGTSQFVFQFVPVIDIFKIHLCCHFFPKNMTRSTTLNCLLNPLHSHRFLNIKDSLFISRIIWQKLMATSEYSFTSNFLSSFHLKWPAISIFFSFYSQTKWSVPKIALMNWLFETWTR